MNRGVTADIDLDALSHNFRKIKGLTSGSPVFAVVKADAYGHGAVEISKRLVAEGAERLAVAFTSEARLLRNAGITAPVIVLFDPDPADAVSLDIIPVVHNLKSGRLVSAEAARRGVQLNVHLKIDTGMGRLGIYPEDMDTITEIASLPNIRVEGFMSHFSEADLSDLSFAREQISRFRMLKQRLSESRLKPKYFHLANSAAVINLPEAHMDAVRPGIMLYGYSPFESNGTGLIPVMKASVKVHSVRRVKSGTPISYGRTFIAKRDSVIAVVGIGYADGYRRSFSNNADVLINGRRAPVAGRICMDLCMADVTDIVRDSDVAEGDEVVIIGRQGEEFISADELAAKAGTISYEVLTSIGSRAARNHISS
ncbi:MAG: alanine racemase [Nitrospiraceae bacterium]|nr:alanine racemase [Nitrospiraceae bacterium]